VVTPDQGIAVVFALALVVALLYLIAWAVTAW